MNALNGVQFGTAIAQNLSVPSILIWRQDNGELMWDAKVDRRTMIVPSANAWIEFGTDGRIFHKASAIPFRDLCLIMVKFLAVQSLAREAIRLLLKERLAQHNVEVD